MSRRVKSFGFKMLSFDSALFVFPTSVLLSSSLRGAERFRRWRTAGFNLACGRSLRKADPCRRLRHEGGVGTEERYSTDYLEAPPPLSLLDLLSLPDGSVGLGRITYESWTSPPKGGQKRVTRCRMGALYVCEARDGRSDGGRFPARIGFPRKGG